MPYTCSKDPTHQSTDSDYCSICGAKIAGAPSLLNTAAGAPASSSAAGSLAGATGSGEACPDCGTLRVGTAKFCEICRYNFETHASGGVSPVTAPPPDPTAIADAPPVAAPPEAVPTVAPTSSAAPVAAPTYADATASAVAAPPTAMSPDAALQKWELVVTVDPTLYVDPDPNLPCPANDPEKCFPLDFAENLIGRRSDSRDIHPEIPLTDPCVSHRHAKLLRQPDGSFVLLDVGSTNGTRLNSIDVHPGVRTPLQDGDQITLGCWTRITIRLRTSP